MSHNFCFALDSSLHCVILPLQDVMLHVTITASSAALSVSGVSSTEGIFTSFLAGSDTLKDSTWRALSRLVEIPFLGPTKGLIRLRVAGFAYVCLVGDIRFVVLRNWHRDTNEKAWPSPERSGPSLT